MVADLTPATACVGHDWRSVAAGGYRDRRPRRWSRCLVYLNRTFRSIPAVRGWFTAMRFQSATLVASCVTALSGTRLPATVLTQSSADQRPVSRLAPTLTTS